MTTRRHQAIRPFLVAALALTAGVQIDVAKGQTRGAAARRARVNAFFDRSRTRSESGDTVGLASNRVAAFDIIVPDNAPPVVRFGAEELQRYLGRITDASFEIKTELGARPGIILGDSPAARSAGIDVNDLARDGYAIHVDADRILIAGRDDPGEKGEILFKVHDLASNDYDLTNDMVWDFERGTLCGVYAFLEECGCRWFFPGDHGERIPRLDRLAIPAMTTVQEPEFSLRVFGRTAWRMPSERHVPVRDLVKREVRDLGMNAVANRMWLMRVRASSEWFAFNHRPPRTRWEQRFGEKHPEYFAVLPSGDRDLGGTSGRRHTGHLCYSEDGVYVETVADVDAYFDGETAEERGIPERYTRRYAANRGWAPNACYGDTVSMLPHDGFRGCHCPGCLAKTDMDGPAWQRHSGLVWPFVAKVARHVETTHPDKLIICLAYSSYSEVPASVDLPDNVIVGVCPRRLNKIYNILGDRSYAELLELIERLSTANEMPLLYWFHHLYRLGSRQATYYGVPMLLPHFFGRFIRDLSRHGRLFFAEMDHDSAMLEHINRYVVFRLLYAPESDVDVIVDDYLNTFYGPGAPFLRPVIADIEEKSVRIAASGMGKRSIWRTLYTPEVLSGYRQAVAKAAEATPGTPYARAVELFGTYVIGQMERGRSKYTAQFEDPAVRRKATLSVTRSPGPIVVDGRLDESSWQGAVQRSLLSNVDGKALQWNSMVKVLHRDGVVYCGFVCEDPRIADEGHQRIFSEDYVEVFLHPVPDSPVFYQVLTYPAGKILDLRCDLRGHKWDETWASEAEFAAVPTDRGWSIEVAVPVRSMLGDEVPTSLSGLTWRGHFCRTIMQAPSERDRFGSSSPFMRGSFRQPDLFGILVFE